MWDETHDVRTFLLAAPEPRRFAHAAGQFMTFALPVRANGERVNRCYTLASPPTRPDRVAITVKRVPGGIGSNWLHDHLKPGVALSAIGPMGEFTCEASTAHRFLFLSAGSGITPLMSMARRAHDLGLDHDILFVHFARTPDDIVFRDELETVARRQASFRAVFVCEDDGKSERWTGERGRISGELLQNLTPDSRAHEIYCCGPAPFMAEARRLLTATGFDMIHYHEESFEFVERFGKLVAEEPNLAAPASFQVEFAQSGRTIECSADMTVLEAARRAGLRLPSSCTKGVCGTCKAQLVSGTVNMQPAGGIRQSEIAAGLALLCCSRPTSDLVVKR